MRLTCALVLVALIVTACSDDDNGGEEPPSPTISGAQTIAGAPSRAAPRVVTSAISIDADPASPTIDANATRAVGEEFDVAATLDRLGEAGAGYQLDIAWNSSVLEFVALTNVAEEAFPTCSPTLSSSGNVTTYCLRTDGAANYIGPLARITFRCMSPGSSQFDLRPPGPEVIGTRIESPPAANVSHELTLTAANVTCA